MPWLDKGPLLPFEPSSAGDTSREAAESMRPTASTLREQIFHLIEVEGRHGMTDLEIEQRTGICGSTVRPRRRELELANRIYHRHDDGEPVHRLTLSNRKAKVWVVAKSRWCK